MLVKTNDHVLAANDHRHLRAPEILIIFIQSVAVLADIKLNVLDSLLRKELLRLATAIEIEAQSVERSLVHIDQMAARQKPAEIPSAEHHLGGARFSGLSLWA